MLDLYSDEIFYWQASTRPALAYSDLPFMAAMLSGVGTWLFGNTALAVRSLFLVMGTALPLLVFWLARPFTSRHLALESAFLSLCLPLGAFLGLVAVPDVPLVFFGLLMIGLFERAMRLGSLGYWIATGVVAALGFSTHYRFALYVFAAFLFLLTSSSHRLLLLSYKPWVAAGLMLIGLIPAIRFNMATDLSGLGYHFLDRHPWSFQTEGLLHPLKQAVLVTPPLYIALLVTLVLLLRAARKGDHRRGLIASFAAVHIGVFMVLAPWADSTRTSIHWPLSGYFPLLVFLPEALRVIYGWLRPTRAKPFTLSIPILGFAGSLLIMIGVGSQAIHGTLQPLLGNGVLSNKMAGWEHFNDHIHTLTRDRNSLNSHIIVTDNYYTGAQVEFAHGDQFSVFNLDADKAVSDGRAVQYLLWQNEGTGLRGREGENAWFITEDSTLSLDDKTEVVTRVCSFFSELKFLEQWYLLGGDKNFSVYEGFGVLGAPINDNASVSTVTQPVCPVPSQAWIDEPPANSTLTGDFTVSGWAFNDGGGIRSLRLLANGEPVAVLELNVSRPDVVAAFSLTGDPSQPVVGFTATLDSEIFPRGNLDIALETTAKTGEIQVFRAVRVFNAGR